MSKTLHDLLEEVTSHLDPSKRDEHLAHLKKYCQESQKPFEYDWQPIKFMETLGVKNPLYTQPQVFRPTLAQQLILEHVENYPSSILNVGRQLGVTTLLLAYALYWVLRQNTIPIYYFSSVAKSSHSDVLKRFELRWPGVTKMSHFHHEHFTAALTTLRGVQNTIVIIDNFDCIPFGVQDELGKMIQFDRSQPFSNKWIIQGQPNRTDKGGKSPLFWNECIKGLHAVSGLVPLTLNGYSRPMDFRSDRFTDFPEDSYLREVMVIPT